MKQFLIIIIFSLSIFIGGVLLGIKESIKLLDKGTKHYKLVVVNQNSLDCKKECKSLDFANIEKVNMDEALLEILVDKTKDEKAFESWDFICEYLKSIESDLLVLYNVDYLFSPDLGNQDIIKNFKYFSRTRKVILFVKGKILGNDLIHGEEGDGDYKRMDISEVLVEGW